jgi:hypothetical protein
MEVKEQLVSWGSLPGGGVAAAVAWRRTGIGPAADNAAPPMAYSCMLSMAHTAKYTGEPFGTVRAATAHTLLCCLLYQRRQLLPLSPSACLPTAASVYCARRRHRHLSQQAVSGLQSLATMYYCILPLYVLHIVTIHKYIDSLSFWSSYNLRRSQNFAISPP